MISAEQMPMPDGTKIDKKLEAEEEYVHKVLRDIEEIKKAKPSPAPGR
jgi:hypothetical protein